MKKSPTQPQQLQVNASISDFSPLLRGPAYLFAGLQSAGVSGIELWIGVKSRWTIGYYQRLAKKYDLPIVSLHQPLWAMTGVWFDEGFFTLAQKLGVQHVTCHPLPNIPLQDRRMQKYFRRLANAQKRTGVKVLVENLPQHYRNGLLHRFFPPALDASDMLRVSEMASKFGLGVTLDTDHIHLPKPHKQPWFNAVLPKVRNVHLSSFGDDKRHLPLYMGDLQAWEFVQYLQKRNYVGTITLEIAWPGSITMRSCDFDAIRNSVKLLQANPSRGQL
jgi:sugar phosphate isomerase/epimerase